MSGSKKTPKKGGGKSNKSTPTTVTFDLDALRLTVAPTAGRGAGGAGSSAVGGIKHPNAMPEAAMTDPAAATTWWESNVGGMAALGGASIQGGQRRRSAW